MKITFATESEVRQWTERSDELSDKAYEAMTNTATLIEEITKQSKGSLVDELVHYVSGALRIAKDLTNTMKEITSTISEVSNKVAKVVDGVTGFIGKIAGVLG